MRPTSFFSAALCGVLCALSIPFTSAVAVLPRQDPGGAGVTCFGFFREPCPPSTTVMENTPNTIPISTGIPTLPSSNNAAQTPPSTDPRTPPQSDAVSSSQPIETGQPSRTSPPTEIVQPTGAVRPTGQPTAAPANTGVVVGGVVGGLLGVALILGVVGFFFWRRRRRSAASASDFGTLEKSLVSSSPPVYTIPGTAYSPPPLQPQQSPAPPITAVESHHLMSSYSEPSHQHHGSGGITPVSVPGYAGATGYPGAAGYAAGNQREVDEDGVSLRSPSPVQDGGRAGERDSVPRLPIYNRGIDNAGRGPAL